MSHLCLSCSSSIRPLDTHRTPCCAAPICAACVARNPRIVDWVPCLRCGDGKQVVKAPQRDVADDERFVIGDDEEDGPPAYEDVADGGDGERPSEDASITNVPTAADETQSSIEPLQHRIQRGETIRSIASRYAMDPHTLIKLNSLPHTALTTHPTVIQTRKYLLLSPSNLRASLTTDPTPGVKWRDEADDPTRAAERRAKRFQLITKTADPRIAKTYLALASDASEGTTLFSYDDEVKEKPRAVTEEEAALARWYEDEEWEARQALPQGAWRGKDKGKGKWVCRAPGMGAEKGVWI